jgi:hypothetical protein
VTNFDDWKPIFSSLSRVNRPKWHPCDLYNFCPEWPNNPYLSIPVEERLRRRQLLIRPPPLSDVSNALKQVNVAMIIRNFIETGKTPTLDELERGIVFKGRDRVCEIAAFEIDWRHSDGIIAKRFVAWLETFRAPWVKQRKVKGKGIDTEQMRKELKALGAWRLLTRYKLKWGKAEEETCVGKSGEEIPPLYDGEFSWNRASKLAEDIISNSKTSRFL